MMIGVLADFVREVMDMDSEQIEPAPSIGTRMNTDYIKGIGKQEEQFVIIPDIEKIFSAGELDLVQQSDLQTTSGE